MTSGGRHPWTRAKGCQVLVSHDIVSNAFKLLAALAFGPILISVGRNPRIGDARRAFTVGQQAVQAE